ncbi:alkaline phosphatase family protein [Natronobiforma cellulositropha]|uniref:alkaline phosphatase family protein n=1 Tax=Natronobiforma cellulositropha TaxID=1679076 RepID=UPI0021D5C96A|nr:alkaline phosphatase family protein [Natronobiforma cellulositropha]
MSEPTASDASVTLVILVDAFRNDYPSPERTPFIAALADEGAYGRVREPFGFQVRPAFFAGLYPETSGISTMFRTAEHTAEAPFSVARYVPAWFDNRRIVDWAIRRGLERYVRYRTPHSALAEYATPADVPLDELHRFDFAEKELPWHEHYVEQQTVFDCLRASDREWAYFGWPLTTGYDSDEACAESCMEAASRRPSFVYLHLSQLDGLGHAHGPDADEIDGGLERVDRLVEAVYTHYDAHYETVNLVLFGDHGMVGVESTIDVLGALEAAGLQPGDGFDLFLDSTIARFWFDDEATREAVSEVVRSLPASRILDEDDERRYRIRFGDDRYGDLFVLVEPGTVIEPNYFHRGGQTVAGMHGYAPEVIDDQGGLLVHAPGRRLVGFEEVAMVDLFPTTLDLLGLPTPETSEGTSLVEPAQTHASGGEGDE